MSNRHRKRRGLPKGWHVAKYQMFGYIPAWQCWKVMPDGSIEGRWGCVSRQQAVEVAREIENGGRP